MSHTRTRSSRRTTPLLARITSSIGLGTAGYVAGQIAAHNTPRQSTSPALPTTALTRTLSRFVGSAQPTGATRTGTQLTVSREREILSMCLNPAPIDLPFNEGEIVPFLESLPQIYAESPPAVWAFWDFVAHHFSPFLGKALARRTTLYTLISPNPGAGISAHIGRETATSHGDDRLTTRLSLLELQYVMIRHGMPGSPNSQTSTPRALKKLASRLVSVSDALEERNSIHRLASARIILADVYLLLERREDANEQMRLAFELAKAFVTDDDRQFTGHLGTSHR